MEEMTSPEPDPRLGTEPPKSNLSEAAMFMG